MKSTTHRSFLAALVLTVALTGRSTGAEPRTTEVLHNPAILYDPQCKTADLEFDGVKLNDPMSKVRSPVDPATVKDGDLIGSGLFGYKIVHGRVLAVRINGLSQEGEDLLKKANLVTESDIEKHFGKADRKDDVLGSYEFKSKQIQVMWSRTEKKPLFVFVGDWMREGERPPDFRNTKWGMSREAVKKLETAKSSISDEDILAFEDTVQGMKCDVVYFFVEDKLVRARYVMEEEHTNKNDYISDYKAIYDSLSKKYGKPKIDRTVWKDDHYKDDPKDWGMAVAVGHLVYYATWTSEHGTMITNTLSGDNFKFQHIVEYEGVEYSKLEREAKEKKSAKDL
jgi:hypothetical protein